MGDYVAEIVAVLYDAHQQRDFQAYQHAHHDDNRVEDYFEALGEGEGQH